MERHVPKVNNVCNSPFQRLPTFGTLRSKGCKRLERYVPKVVWGNRFVSSVRTHARGLELKVPKVLNVWNVTFQRLLTFGTVRSKGSERLERCVPKVVWRNRCVSHAIASTSYHHHHSMFLMSRSSRGHRHNIIAHHIIPYFAFIIHYNLHTNFTFSMYSDFVFYSVFSKLWKSEKQMWNLNLNSSDFKF